MPLVERMTVAGVGLIGGSLAAAAREAGLVGEILGFGRSAANLAIARERGLVDRVVTDDAAAADADDRQPLDERRHRPPAPRTVSSARTRRSFSSGSPMLTRRCSGKP